MKFQETKYRLDSFSMLQKRLNEIGAKKTKTVVSTHYYTRQTESSVLKLVEYSDRSEIHILAENSGKFTLKENIPVKSVKAGFEWLKHEGYDVVDVIKMANTDYAYKNGVIGMYTIDDFLLSAILDYPETEQLKVATELGLKKADRLAIPYNKLMKQIGKLRSLTID